MSEVNITYETLFEILRLEKTREQLQELDANFYRDVINYIKDKKESYSEDSSTSMQLKNVRKILEELYERREKKIINLALDKSRFDADTGKEIKLKEEKDMFDSMVTVFDNFRKGIIQNVINANGIEIAKSEQEGVKENKPKLEGLKLVKFMHAVPKFVGSDLEIYGPFEKEDVANLPDKVATVLITKKRVEAVIAVNS